MKSSRSQKLRAIFGVMVASALSLSLTGMPAFAEGTGSAGSSAQFQSTTSSPDGTAAGASAAQTSGAASGATDNSSSSAPDGSSAVKDGASDSSKSVSAAKPQGGANSNDADSSQAQKKSSALSVHYQAHVQTFGTQAAVKDGALAGTTGKSKRVEALTISLFDESGKAVNGISYRAHVQKIGWQNWVSDGAQIGTQGRGLRMEALRIKLSDALAKDYDIYYRTHVQHLGWLAWVKNGEATGSTGHGYRIEGIQICIRRKGEAAPASNAYGVTSQRSYGSLDGTAVEVRAHVQRIGWQKEVSNGTAGTTGRGLRVEALTAKVSGSDLSGSLHYKAHVQRIGWQGERVNGQVAGTTGKSYRLEGISFWLDGELAQHYDVYYRTHIQKYGWLGWAKDGALAGTEGFGRRMEAVQVRLVPKGSPAPSASGSISTLSYIKPISITYATQSSGQDWQTQHTDGTTAGTTGQSLAVERFHATLDTKDLGSIGLVSYAVQETANGAWTADASNGADAGTAGSAIEGVRLHLTGEASKLFDVWYRAHSSSFGWLTWTKNGASAGSQGYGRSIQAIQVKVLPKGSSAPSSSGTTAYVDKTRMPQSLVDANAKQRKVVFTAKKVPSPGAGLCSEWVTNVFRSAGFGSYYGDADDLYYAYCKTSDISKLKVGMIVAVGTHPHTYMGRIYGHVGIYVGDGKIMDNIGWIRTMSVYDWINHYGSQGKGTVPAKWGWMGNRHLA